MLDTILKKIKNKTFDKFLAFPGFCGLLYKFRPCACIHSTISYHLEGRWTQFWRKKIAKFLAFLVFVGLL
jgi:hypothetical protein